MAKVTSKLQVTMPKALAARYGIAPGDDIAWEAAGDVIRVVPPRKRPARTVSGRLRLFDQATARQQKRDEAASVAPDQDRGWSRDDLSTIVAALVDTNVLVYRFDARFPEKTAESDGPAQTRHPRRQRPRPAPGRHRIRGGRDAASG